MADSKQYYYLKLKDNFFDSDEIIILESMQDGYLYSNILLKLYLRSLKNEGRLMLNDRIPYSPEMLSKITRHQVGTVEKAVKILREVGLIEILDNGAIYMSDIQNLIGKSSTEADRKRDYRQRIANEQSLIEGQTSGQMSGHSSDNPPPEKEIELELKLDIKNFVQKLTIDKFFKTIWDAYPCKKGKGKISDKQKEALLKQGEEVILKCIERYKNDKPDWTEYQHGSTFFKSGYIDYLDENYQKQLPTQARQKGKVEQRDNFKQRDYGDLDDTAIYANVTK